MIENLNDVLYAIDRDLVITYVNSAAKRVLDYSPEELVGKPFAFLIHGEDLPEIRRGFNDVLSNRLYPSDYRVLTKSGDIRWVRTSSRPVFNGQQLLGLCGVMIDITDRKQAIAALEDSEARLAAMFRTNPAAIAISRLGDGRLADINDAWVDLTGYSRAEAIDHTPLELSLWVDPRQRERLIESVRRHGSARCEMQLRSKSGELLNLLMSAATFESGRERYLLTMAVDITERMRAEGELLASEGRLRGITDSAMDAIVMLTPDGQVFFWNPAAERTFGYSGAEAMGRGLHELIVPQRYHSAYRSGLSNFREKGSKTDIGRTLELEACRKDGEEIPVSLSLSAVLIGGAYHAMGIIRDMSEYRAAEASVRANEETLRLILDNAHDAFISVDSDGVITNWNAKAERLFGWTIAEVTGCPLEVIMPSRFRTDDAEDCQWGLATTPNENVSRQFETATVARDGREFPVEATLWSISVKGMWQLNIFLRDLSDAKAADGELMQLEMQLRQAQKLEAIGALAAGISHEINTPTQYVGDNIRFMASAFADMDKALFAAERALLAARANTLTPQLVDEVESEFGHADVAYLRGEVPLALAQAEEGVQRVSAIVRAMKEFAHPGPLQKAPADLNQAIESTVTVCRNEWKYVADLTLDLDPALPPVPCQIGEVKQVILNLIVNAAHAIGEVGPGDNGKGRITITTGRDGQHAVVRVRDTGAGIPEAVRDRIFDPFFTTKPVGKGSGQGLAIAHNVITVKHHGSIAFESSFGHGTEFVIRLPFDVAPDAVAGDEHEEANTVRG